MTTSTIDRARLEELLGEYWEIAFEESSGVVAIGNKANRVLHEIRALFYALAAPATAPEQPRPFIPWSKEAEMLESWAAQPERKPPQGDAMTTREAFEAFISAPPFEMPTERFDDRCAWPGGYTEAV